MSAVLGQIGLGVSDLQRSIDFYTTTLSIGLVPTDTFDTPDFKETILAQPRPAKGTPASQIQHPGSQIALMQYKDGVVPTRQQGKLVFFVDDVEEVMERAKKAGAEVYSEYGEGDGVMEYVGIVRDPDGFLVEFLPMMFLQAAQGSKL